MPVETIGGEVIVARECLVDGVVTGDSLNEIIQTRIRSMHEMYGTSKDEYLQKAVPELRKMAEIDGGEVNLWFEDDLFCQVNLWFVCDLLKGKSLSIYLVRPTGSLRYGFAGHQPEELPELLKNKIALSTHHITLLSKLWKAYQSDDQTGLTEASRDLANDLPFVEEAVEAHLKRLPYGKGLTEQSLIEIMNEFDTRDFGVVFSEFSKRYPIYGFGDLQVKRLFDQLTEE